MSGPAAEAAAIRAAQQAQAPVKPLAAYTPFELDRCLRITGALLGELGACTPERVRAVLDSWAADMRAERERRQEPVALSRRARAVPLEAAVDVLRPHALVLARVELLARLESWEALGEDERERLREREAQLTAASGRG